MFLKQAFLLEYGLCRGSLYDGCSRGLLNYLPYLLMNNRTVNLMNDILVLLVDHGLVDLSYHLLVDYGLDVLMNDWLMMLMDNIAVVLMYDWLMMLMNYLRVMLLNYGCLLMLLNARCRNILLDQALLRFSQDLRLHLMCDNLPGLFLDNNFFDCLSFIQSLDNRAL